MVLRQPDQVLPVCVCLDETPDAITLRVDMELKASQKQFNFSSR